jgi:hypothetical protein
MHLWPDVDGSDLVVSEELLDDDQDGRRGEDGEHAQRHADTWRALCELVEDEGGAVGMPVGANMIDATSSREATAKTSSIEISRLGAMSGSRMRHSTRRLPAPRRVQRHPVTGSRSGAGRCLWPPRLANDARYVSPGRASDEGYVRCRTVLCPANCDHASANVKTGIPSSAATVQRGLPCYPHLRKPDRPPA